MHVRSSKVSNDELEEEAKLSNRSHRSVGFVSSLLCLTGDVVRRSLGVNQRFYQLVVCIFFDLPIPVTAASLAASLTALHGVSSRNMHLL